ncbi:hypothetical protein ACFWH4_14935 [Streptomyces sp. NPDC127091]|uniref:hypothetical protein n=1 Tax=Streptomyces sp. NPDC127091 TaxID=3347134 RepID=UPI00365557B0
MLLRLACLGATNAFAVLRLLPMSDRGKDVEILALRHQITVLERRPARSGPRFDAGDRVFLAALPHPLTGARARGGAPGTGDGRGRPAEGGGGDRTERVTRTRSARLGSREVTPGRRV